MKVSITHFDKEHGIKNKKLYGMFIKYLQKLMPLKHDVEIHFLNKRVGHMTTGSRTKDNILKILTKGRINRDVLRTLSHEWAHEYQRTILNRGKGPDIGGPNENEANAISGIIMKKFEKEFPNFEQMMYE